MLLLLTQECRWHLATAIGVYRTPAKMPPAGHFNHTALSILNPKDISMPYEEFRYSVVIIPERVLLAANMTCKYTDFYSPENRLYT